MLPLSGTEDLGVYEMPGLWCAVVQCVCAAPRHPSRERAEGQETRPAHRPCTLVRGWVQPVGRVAVKESGGPGPHSFGALSFDFVSSDSQICDSE